MAPPMLMSRAQVDETTLAEIARGCNVSTTDIEDVYSCTSQQLAQIAETRSEVFQFVLTFGPTVDIDRWSEAVRQVVSMNSALRTRVVQSGLGTVQAVTAEEHVIEHHSGDFEQFLHNDAKRYLGLGMPLFRSTLVDRRYVATIHHAVMDFWSITTFLEDGARIYLGHPPMKRPKFKEFVAYCLNVDEAAAKSFWASRFKGISAVFPRVEPGYCPRPTGEITRKILLKRIGNGVSPAHLPWFAEAAWALTVATYADSESVAYGLVLSGRSPSLNGVETTLGPTVAEVPVQVNLQRNMTIERLIKDRATSLRQLQTNHALHYGLARIGQVSEAARAASGLQSLFNVLPPLPVTLSSSPEDADAVQLTQINYLARGAFALNILNHILDDGLRTIARYDPAVLSERQLHRVLSQYEYTLQFLTGNPLQMRLDKLQRLNPDDCSEILQWNNTVPKTINRSLNEVFSVRARMQPDATAVEAGDGSMSYSELDQMSSYLARELQRRSVVPGQPVALVSEKSLWSIVAILGIMKAGAVCVPINNDDPYDRSEAILSSLKANIILTSSAQRAPGLMNLVPHVFVISADSLEGLSEVTGPHESETKSPEDLAYIMFTSGTTGVPKAVMLEHRGIVSSLMAVSHRLDWAPACRMLQFASLASNSSIYEIFGALLFGGCLCIPSAEPSKPDPARLIKSTKANWAILAPATLRDISPSDVPELHSLLSIGEAVDADAFRTWGTACRFFNGWGVCEASMLSTIAELDPSCHYSKSVGTPINCAVWIVNPRNIHELSPIGSVGELLIQGPSVARGYLNDQAKTAAAFISPPLWASSLAMERTRFFRTGDLAKYNPDGSISFVGRQDNRVKLGGQSIQLEEVEGTLASCGEVRDIGISARISAGRTQLVAVVCLADPQLPRGVALQELPNSHAKVTSQQLEAIRAYARSRLPSERIPTAWLTVQDLPHTASEKLDRAALRQWLKALRR